MRCNCMLLVTAEELLGLRFLVCHQAILRELGYESAAVACCSL